MPDPHTELAAELARSLGPLLPDGPARVCFIDPPAMPNVGDSAIFLGELAFLRRHRPDYRPWFVDHGNFARHMEPWVERSDLVLIQGGGNFGDLWPEVHEFRLRIMERFAHKKIVQMPQSIHFTDPARIQETAKIVDRQHDFTLLVRDNKSHELARETFGCPLVLAPDLALALGPLRRSPPVIDYLCLLRTDREAKANHDAITGVLADAGTSFEVADWVDEPPTFWRLADRHLIGSMRRWPFTVGLLRGVSLRAREHYGRGRLACGTGLLSRGRAVVTDRLHAHVLCCLLGIPHFVFDSLDGKVFAMHRTWTHRFGLARVVASPTELAEALAASDQSAGALQAPRK